MQKLAEICVRRPVFATMLILALTVVGIFSYFSLGVDLFPKIDLPTVTVTVTNPGSSPQEVETEITDKVEEAVNTISGIDELRSTSVEGVSQVFITFLLEKNADVAAQEVRDKVNLIVPDLPETAEVPIIQKLDTDAAPVLQIAVSAPRSLRDVTDTADKQIKKRIESINGVGNVEIVGGREREIQVWVDPDKLRAFNVTVAQVAAAVRSQNLELPGGRIDEGTRELTVRTMGRIADPARFNDIVVANRGTYAVKVSDIGYVEDGAEEQRTQATLDGKPAVTLVVSKQSGQNTVAVADAVKQRLSEIAKNLPPDYKTEIVGDQSIFIKAAVDSIKTHLIEGGLMAALVVFLFLWNFRSTLIAAIAIPTSIIATFGLMTAMLAARLIKQKREKEEPVGPDGVVAGDTADSVGTAGGARAVRKISGDSSAEARTEDGLHPAHDSKDSRFYRPIDRTYSAMLRWSMNNRWAIVLVSVLVIISIVPLFMFVGKNFLPTDDQSQFEVSVRAPEGSTLAATDAIVEKVATSIRQMDGVADTLVTIGGGQQQLVNSASIYVKLKPIENRKTTQDQLMLATREQVLSKLPKELRTSVQPVAAISGGGNRNSDIQYVVGGPDLQKLTEYAQKILDKMKTIPDVVDADSSLVLGKPEIQVEIDRPKAADLGVQVGDISQALNTLIAGQKVSTFNAGTDQYNVRVRAMGEFRASTDALKRMIVSSTKLGYVSLDNIVNLKEASGPSAIDRLNRQRQVTLLANVKPGGSQSAVIDQLNTFVKQMNVPGNYTTGLAGRSKELGRAGYYFLLAISLSFIFMYMVLAAQFESFIHPVTILLTLPLAIPFGILSLLITGQTVNIFSGLGLLLLFGVVKKNAILQIDHTNQLRARGMERLEAIIRANRDRLRPILMTTIALVAGMLPLTISSGPGSGTNRSIGVLVVGGQSLCLLLTLLAGPVFYSLFDDLARSRVFRTIAAGFGGAFAWVRRKTANATASLLGLISRQ